VTELSLDVSQTNNLKVIRIFDTSQYGTEVIANYLIEVLPVNKNNWVTYRVDKEFSLTLNSSNLGYKKVNNTADLVSLPDGIYEIRQSYKPNASVVIHYYHLRTVELRLKYLELLCNHFNDECKKDMRTYATEADKLTHIREYIEAAEYSTNDRHDKKTGIKYYNKAIDLLKEFEDGCGCR
jgi:hypothetical protein